MSRAHHRILALLGALGLQLLASPAIGQELAPNSATGISRPNPPLPMLMQGGKGPFELFRTVFYMSTVERQRFLLRYSPDKRRALQSKIKEYDTLTPEQRELKLRVTELRAYLLPLMSIPATNRAPYLSALPAEIAPLVKARLESWDRIPPDQQKALLENEGVMQHLTRFASISPIEQSQVLTNMTPAQRDALREGIRKWQALPESQRETIARRVQEYFSLTPVEQQKTLGVLSDTERGQIEKTINSYRDLSPATRIQIFRGLEKVSELTPVQLADFLKNAERWTALSPSERQAWRDLVTSAAFLPPLPPGPRPPRPPPVAPNQATPPGPVKTGQVATNQ